MLELVVIGASSTIAVVVLVLAFGVAAYRRGYRRGVEDGARIIMVCAPGCPHPEGTRRCPNEDRWLD